MRVGTGSSGDCCPVNSGVRVLEAELTGRTARGDEGARWGGLPGLAQAWVCLVTGWFTDVEESCRQIGESEVLAMFKLPGTVTDS